VTPRGQRHLHGSLDSDATRLVLATDSGGLYSSILALPPAERAGGAEV
jgi:hypothetical protein